MRPVAPKYQRPQTLQAALNLLKQGFVPIAGGTDYYPSKVGRPLVDKLVDLSGVIDFNGSSVKLDPGSVIDQSGVFLSALMTWRRCQMEFSQRNLPIWCAALAQSAKDVGGWQVQNRGTLGGNLCNASPAADGVVALLALGAKVALVSESADQPSARLKIRILELSDFVLGNRHTARASDELLTQIQLPEHSSLARSVFLKLGHRKYLVISIVMVAILLDFDEDGFVTTCRVAIGSCSKTALRVLRLERLVLGKQRDQVLVAVKGGIAEVVAAIQPIDDVRGTALYRQSASQELVLRAFSQVLQ
jgi:CO/xanthine dehydrogenase FAD-binding subunit